MFIQLILRGEDHLADVTLPGSGGAPVFVVLQILAPHDLLLADGASHWTVMLRPGLLVGDSFRDTITNIFINFKLLIIGIMCFLQF